VDTSGRLRRGISDPAQTTNDGACPPPKGRSRRRSFTPPSSSESLESDSHQCLRVVSEALSPRRETSFNHSTTSFFNLPTLGTGTQPLPSRCVIRKRISTGCHRIRLPVKRSADEAFGGEKRGAFFSRAIFVSHQERSINTE